MSCRVAAENGKLYLTSRHRGILVYDPQTKQVSTLVYTYRNQLFKGPNDLDFDADGNLFFTDPWGTGPGQARQIARVQSISIARRLFRAG